MQIDPHDCNMVGCHDHSACVVVSQNAMRHCLECSTGHSEVPNTKGRGSLGHMRCNRTRYYHMRRCSHHIRLGLGHVEVETDLNDLIQELEEVEAVAADNSEYICMSIDLLN